MAARKRLSDTRLTIGVPNEVNDLQPKPEALDEAAKGQVYRQWRRGVSLAVLSQEHGRSTATIEGVITEMRAERILEQPLEFMTDPSFEAPDASAILLAPFPERPRAAGRSEPPAGLPSYLASLYGAPLLNHAQELHLFRKMNYLKYRASKLREALDPADARASDLDEIERLQAEALVVKNRIIRANLRLVVSIAKKRLGISHDLFELVSDGNMSLIRAVEKFDFARGFKFSTYASWAILKNFARTFREEKSRRDRFVTGHEEMFQAAPDHRSDEHESESDHLRNQEAVRKAFERLNDRERRILASRYGLDGARESTLSQIGRDMGISKERVRQIESRAQDKLRTYAPNTMSL